MFWCLCHSEHDSGCRQCLDDRKREPVRDILNQTSSGNCRLSFPCFMDRHSVSTLRWLFPSSPDKWRSPSWLLTPCHSFLPCGSSGSGPAQAINHGDKSAQRLLFSVHTSCHPMKWSRGWSTWVTEVWMKHGLGLGNKKCRFLCVCIPWAKVQFSSSVEIEVIHYLEAIYNWFKWDKKSF